MVRVGIWSTSKTKLVIINGNLNWQRYVNAIIVPEIVPTLQRIGNGAVSVRIMHVFSELEAFS